MDNIQHAATELQFNTTVFGVVLPMVWPMAILYQTRVRTYTYAYCGIGTRTRGRTRAQTYVLHVYHGATLDRVQQGLRALGGNKDGPTGVAGDGCR